MKLFIAIKEGKVFDICSEIINKRDINTIPDEDYIQIEVESMDIYFGDTWNFDNNINIPNSPLRFVEPEKTPLELKVEQLESRLLELENKSNGI